MRGTWSGVLQRTLAVTRMQPGDKCHLCFERGVYGCHMRLSPKAGSAEVCWLRIDLLKLGVRKEKWINRLTVLMLFWIFHFKKIKKNCTFSGALLYANDMQKDVTKLQCTREYQHLELKRASELSMNCNKTPASIQLLFRLCPH